MTRLSCLVFIMALLAAPLSATEVVLASTLEATADWREAGWSETWNHKGHLRVGEADGQRHLEVAVEVAADAKLGGPEGSIAVRAGRVYDITFEGRAVGQIEGVGVNFFRGPAPHTWHGSDHFPVVRDWRRFRTQIMPASDDDRTILIFAFKGMGSFHIRTVTVVEKAAFDLTGIQDDAPARGELLNNGTFALGDYGWHYTVPEWGDHAARFQAEGHDRQRIVKNAAGDGWQFQAPAGIFGFLNHLELVTLRYGQRYRLRVTGSGADGDANVWFERPRQNLGPVHSKKHLTFRDGVAETEFVHELPRSGVLSMQPSNLFVLLEHSGKAPLTVTSISVAELGSTPQDADAVQASIAITGLDSPLANATTIGMPLHAVVRVVGTPAAALSLVIRNARQETVVTLPVPTAMSESRLALPALPLGWYHARVAVDGADLPGPGAVFAVLPPARTTEESKGFLGAHIRPGRFDARQAAHLASLGVRHARCFEFSWPTIEPKRGEYRFPEEALAFYADAGVEPMVILNGSPHWASSAPEKILADRNPWAGWSAYPPRSQDDWQAFVTRTVTLLKGRVRVYQIWNEPNDYFLKINPEHHPSVAAAYVALARTAYAAIKAIDPEAIVVVGATAGRALGFFDQCFALGLLDACDVISYHAYGEDSPGSAAQFADHVRVYREKMAAYGHNKPIWDCESGWNIEDGPAGLAAAHTLIRGLINREAGGIARHYLYTSAPRTFPHQANFHMLTGFADQPLVSTPMLAVYDCLLGDARPAGDLSDAERGIHLHTFTGPDGTVLVGWQQSSEPVQRVSLADGIPRTTVDVFGVVPTPTPDAGDATTIALVAEPRYFILPAHHQRLGGG